METIEIILNDDVIEKTEEIASSGKCFKVAAGIGIAVFAGVVTYTYVVKPLWTKHKQKKEQSANPQETFVYFNEESEKTKES